MGALGGFGDSLLGGLLNNYFARGNADHAFDQMKEFWNMQNEYNHPAAQMARFKEAGLNPNLIYGQMGNSQSAPVVSTAKPNSGGVGFARGVDMAQAVQNINNLAQQRINLETDRVNSIKNTDANVALKRAEVDKVKAETAELSRLGGSGPFNYTRNDPWYYRLGGKTINKLYQYFGRGFSKDNWNRIKEQTDRDFEEWLRLNP